MGIFEALDTLARLLREWGLLRAQFDQALRKLRVHERSWAEMSPTAQVRELAERVLPEHALGSADGLQLAAALAWCGERPRRRAFVGGDKKPSDAAEALDFDVRCLPA